MSLSRRKFIQLSSLASAATMMPSFLQAFTRASLAPAGGRVLVVLQLSGGNDGLNTVIPFRNDIYYRSREKLAIAGDTVLKLTDDAGLHPSMVNMKNFYDQGWLSIINSVGYPGPDRSHFRSMDIWQTGSGSNELLTNGWIGRYLDTACNNCDQHNIWGVEVDDSLSLAMKGGTKSGIAVSNIDRFYRAATSSYVKRLSYHAAEHEERLAGYLYKTLTETTASAEYIYKQSKLYTSTQLYPNTRLGKRLKMIGQLINSGSETKVYYVSHGSFDTHVGQADRQGKLLKDMDDALGAFVTDLKGANKLNDVMVMGFSEFGRRVAQNASNGTDHGTANCMFMIGGGLKKQGFYNKLPDLNDLDAGDLKYELDFRRVYATVLDNWLGANSTEIMGKIFEKLGFV